MPIGLSPNCRVWARKDAVVGGSEWVLATVAGGADMVNGKDTVQVLLPGTKRRKTLSSADVVPTTVQVVLEPLENLADDAVMIPDNNQNKENRKKGKHKLKNSLGKKKTVSAEHDFNARAKKEKLIIENDDGEKEGEFTVIEEEISEYERIRLKNIAQRQEMFAKLKADMMALKKDIAPTPKQRCSANRHRAIMLYSSRKERVVTRSRRNSAGWSEPSSGSNSGTTTPTKRKRFWEEMSDLSDSDEEETPKRTYVRNPNPGMWMKNPNINILMPEDITDKMLENVADRVSDKVYSQDGTTCHQCRQKTTDVKTVCRSGNCAGVRGYFCGVCLLNRYGQNAREALKDPNWICPPCMDVCNCSICRNRMGKGATGPITYLAQAKGFKCVKDYLESLKKEKGSDEFDDE